MLVRAIYAHDDEKTMRLKAQIIIRELQPGTKISYPIQDFATGMKFAEVLKTEDTESKLVHIYVWRHYINIEANYHGLQFACSIVPCATSVASLPRSQCSVVRPPSFAFGVSALSGGTLRPLSSTGADFTR